MLVDEPYLVVGQSDWENPCDDGDPRLPDMVRMQRYLIIMAAAVREFAPLKTRFWVNFSEPEILWMRAENCPFRINDWYMDVVSMDIYEVPFNNQVRSHYDWLFANRPTAYQQLALIPGTFRVYGANVVNATLAADWVSQYFDYANHMNASCTLPIGRTGVTKSFDGCPIWLVAGFSGDANTHQEQSPGVHWVSLLDPSSFWIRGRWRAQLTIPTKNNLLGRVDTYDILRRTSSSARRSPTVVDVMCRLPMRTWFDENSLTERPVPPRSSLTSSVRSFTTCR